MTFQPRRCLGEGLEDQKPCRFGTCVDLFVCNHLDCLDEELPIYGPAWDDTEVCQRLELATIKKSMEELESVVEFVKDEVEEFVSSESAWLKEEEQGPPEALEPRGQPNQGLADVHSLSKPRGRPLQKGFAEDHLPAQVGSLAPILGEGQEQKKEEVLPGFSRCRPSS